MASNSNWLGTKGAPSPPGAANSNTDSRGLEQLVWWLHLLSMNVVAHPNLQKQCECSKDILVFSHLWCSLQKQMGRTCEICGSTAHNVAGVVEVEMTEQANEASMVPPTGRSAPIAESRSFWQGHRFLNFLLACMFFTFVISWLFHFNVPS